MWSFTPTDSATRLWSGAPDNKGSQKGTEYLSLSYTHCHQVCCPTEQWICIILSLSFARILTGALLVAALVSSKLELQGSLSAFPHAQEMFLYSSKVALLLSSVYFAEVVQEPLCDATCLTLSHRPWPAAIIHQASLVVLEACFWHQPCSQVLIGCVHSCLNLACPLEKLRRAVSGSHACYTLPPPQALQSLLICSGLHLAV